MAEKIPHDVPNSPDKLTTPQEKLAILWKEYEKFSDPPYTTMDPAFVGKAKENVWNSIVELKNEYPELNN